MNRTTIVRIAEWTGWCGPCAAERPLVLTRTGRHTLRSWLVGADSTERPLTLTCRLCGVGVGVPPEADDPEVAGVLEPFVPMQLAPVEVVPLQDVPALAVPAQDVPAQAVPAQAVPAQAVPAQPVPAQPVAEPSLVPLPTLPVRSAVLSVEVSTPVPDPGLQAARQEVATALSALVRRREDAVPRTSAVLPQQRTSEAPALDGLQALQLLAEGLDLLSTHR